MKFNRHSLLIAILSLGIAACAGAGESHEDMSADSTAASPAMEAAEQNEASFQFDMIIANNIAAPVKLLTDMSQAGLNNYQETATHSTNEAGSYATSEEKALAFGVYGADLSYKSLYGKHQEMADYLIAIRKLSDDLGMTNLFDQNSYETFERIKSNPDSVKMFIFDKYDEADEYLRSNDRLNTAALILTGGLIESLHLVSVQIESGDANKDAYKIFLGQKNTLKSLLDLYASLEKEGKSITLKGDIEMLYGKFTKFDSFEKFSKESIREVHVAIDEVRNKLV